VTHCEGHFAERVPLSGIVLYAVDPNKVEVADKSVSRLILVAVELFYYSTKVHRRFDDYGEIWSAMHTYGLLI